LYVGQFEFSHSITPYQVVNWNVFNRNMSPHLQATLSDKKWDDWVKKK